MSILNGRDEKELRRPITQDETFKATHTRKKKIPGDLMFWYEYAYGLPQRTFCEFNLELEGLSSFQDYESREMILDLKQQIAKVSSEAKALQARKRQRDIQYAGMKAQFDVLPALGGIPPCCGDVVHPPDFHSLYLFQMEYIVNTEM
ncbi:putative zinc finger protein CONSTANS-LIKE 10-like [Capsicum annuum]|nr:putative zinc finger protein CONSTANS-LIKE 10-like [Capsicum annuum]